MPMIRETIVTTVSAEGKVYIAPLGLIAEPSSEGWIIAPFKPSTTLDNLRANPYAVANFTDDVLVFAVSSPAASLEIATGRRCPQRKFPA